MPSKFLLGKAPFQRSVDEKKISTTRIMGDVLIALTPIILFAWFKNGLYPYIKGSEISFWDMIKPLVFILIGGIASYVFEYLYFLLFKKVRGFKNLLKVTWLDYAVIPGIILALILPYNTPIWVLLIGCLVANIIFKMLFGGFGHNIYNPALIAYVFLIAGYAGLLNPGGALSAGDLLSSTSAVTPLTNYQGALGGTYETLVAPYGSLWNFFLGTVPGALGETSALLCLVGFIYLLVRKVINWRVPVIYVGTVFVLSWLVGAVNGQTGLWYPTFNILSGGLMFGAVFMATEPVTTPKSQVGKVIFAFLLGALTVLFRHIGAYPEGVATAILFASLFTPVIDRFAAVQHASSINRKVVLKYCACALIVTAIAGYAVIKAIPSNETPVVEEQIVFNDQTLVQDFVTLDFKGSFTKGETTFNVLFKLDNNQLTVSSVDTDLTSDQKKAVLDLVKGKLPDGYITSMKLEGNNIVITIKQKGFGGNMVIDVTINNKVITKYEVVSQSESYEEEYNSAYNKANGDPIKDYPAQLVGNVDLDSLASISGATYTSNYLKNAYKVATTFINQINQIPVIAGPLSQDYLKVATFNADYLIKGNVYTVEFSLNNNELTITNIDESLNETDKNIILAEAKKMLPKVYVTDIVIDATKETVTITSSEGYANGKIVVEVEIVDKIITKYTIKTQNESYAEEYNSAYSKANGDPITDYPSQLVGNVDVNELGNISGATYTSNALKNIYLCAKAYIDSYGGVE